jgi:multidrug efflux pump subunit AcrA (membrane-fusion protein)
MASACYAPFPGRLRRPKRQNWHSGLVAQAGLAVKEGDLLARLDESDFQNTLKERQARYDLAKVKHDQISKLKEKEFTSQLQLDQTASELKSARAALKQARDNLRYTSLVAPFDGVVARVDIDNFQAVQAKTPIIQLQADDRLDIRFSVPESLISQLKLIEDPAMIEGVCGIVRFSDFLPDDVKDALLVPVEAVFEKEGAKRVWRIDPDMRAQLVSVEVGRISKGLIEITNGLNLDDRVAAAGVSYIHEGMLLRPVVKERGL